jgi:hypothetical protein
LPILSLRPASARIASDMYCFGTYPPAHLDPLYDLFMPRATQLRSQIAFQPDPSVHMLGLPRPRPRFDWFLFAVAAGTLLAVIVLVISDLIF